MRTAAGGISVFAPVSGWVPSFCLSGRVRPVGPIPGADPPAAGRLGARCARAGAGSGPGLSLVLALAPVQLYEIGGG